MSAPKVQWPLRMVIFPDGIYILVNMQENGIHCQNVFEDLCSAMKAWPRKIDKRYQNQ